MKKRKILLFLILIICAVFFIWCKMENIESISDLKNKISEIISGEKIEVGYNAKSLLMVDLSNDEEFVFKNIDDKQVPASLAKLFVIDYAMTIANEDDIVLANPEAVAMIKPSSSVANINNKKYYLKDLYAAMLIPSGNDAAYVVADYCGGKISPELNTSNERVKLFISELNKYLKKQGYKNTVINDPSGYDENSYTTVVDLKKVSTKLIKNKWIRETIAKYSYTAILLDGTKQTWENTNEFLNPNSNYYNKNVIGIKTGSLFSDYNLIVLYKMHDKEFLICSLGSQSNYSRYDDVNYILQTIDKSDYLKK